MLGECAWLLSNETSGRIAEPGLKYRLSILMALGFSALVRAPEAHRAVVPLTQSARVAVLDLDSLTVLASIPTRPHPQDVVVAPDRAQALVLEMGTTKAPGSSIAVVDLKRMEVVRHIELAPYRQPHWAQLSGDGRMLWVACAPDQVVLELDVVNGGVSRTWRVPDAGPWMFVVTPDERTLVVAGFESGTASVVNRETGRLRRLRLSGSPIGIAASPDGRAVWIGAARTDRIYVVDVASATVTARFSSAGKEPARMAFTPDGTRVVVTNSRSDTVTIYDARTRRVTKSVPTGANSWPKGLAVAPDGTVAYVSLMDSGRVLVLDLATGAVRGEVRVGESPERVALDTVAR
jgi:YVTN family beta-propeller protein